MSISISVPKDYGYVAIAVAVMGVVQFGLGARAMSLRYFFKTDEFRTNKKVLELQEEHKKAFGTEINEFGYPDMGNGRYMDLLPYEFWVKFNNHQRAHYNMIEISGPVLAAGVVGGLVSPRFTAASLFIHSLGRVVYAIGYTTSKGADGRLVGAVLASATQFMLFGSSVYAGLTFLGHINQ